MDDHTWSFLRQMKHLYLCISVLESSWDHQSAENLSTVMFLEDEEGPGVEDGEVESEDETAFATGTIVPRDIPLRLLKLRTSRVRSRRVLVV